MAKLYELAGAYALLLESEEEHIDDNTGEVTSPFAEALATLEGEIEGKVDGCAKVIREFEANIEALKVEEERLFKRRKSEEAKKDSLRNYVRENLKLAGIEKIKTVLFTVYLSKAKEKVLILDESKLADRFMVTKRAPNKVAIKDALDAGQLVDGAVLEMGEQPLTIR